MKITPYGNYLVYEPRYSIEDINQIIVKNNLSGLRVLSLLESEFIGNIDFLERATFLKKLSIVSSETFDYSFLSKLTGLESLEVDAPGYSFYDFSYYERLMDLSISLRRKKAFIILPEHIQYLYLEEVKSKNIDFIKGCDGLKSLIIKSSTIDTLDGIARMKNLISIELGGIYSLSNINLIPLKMLSKIKLDSVRSLESIHISEENSLEELVIRNCSNLSEIYGKHNIINDDVIDIKGKTKVVGTVLR